MAQAGKWDCVCGWCVWVTMRWAFEITARQPVTAAELYGLGWCAQGAGYVCMASLWWRALGIYSWGFPFVLSSPPELSSSLHPNLHLNPRLCTPVPVDLSQSGLAPGSLVRARRHTSPLAPPSVYLLEPELAPLHFAAPLSDPTDTHREPRVPETPKQWPLPAPALRMSPGCHGPRRRRHLRPGVHPRLRPTLNSPGRPRYRQLPAEHGAHVGQFDQCPNRIHYIPLPKLICIPKPRSLAPGLMNRCTVSWINRRPVPTQPSAASEDPR